MSAPINDGGAAFPMRGMHVNFGGGEAMNPLNAAYAAKIVALEKENARLRLLIEEQKSVLQWAKEIIQEQTLVSK